MDNKPLTFIFLGKSGCGKGTQANLLQKYLEVKNRGESFLYVYTGDRLRELVEKNTYTAKLAKQIMADGKIEPNFLAVWAWASELVEKMNEGTHLIIDGSPRSKTEAELLDGAFEFYGRENVRPILIDVSDEWAMDRLLGRKRADDTREKIKNRLNFFTTDVQPAIDYYGGRIIRINGEQQMAEVHADIIKALGV